MDKIYIHQNGGDFSELGQISGIYSHRVATKENLLYTSENSIYDISDPANPVEIIGHSYYGSTSNGEMEIVGNFLLTARGDNGNPRAQVFDISDTQNIELLATFDNERPSFGIDIVGGRLYVAFGSMASTNGWDGYAGGSVEVYDIQCDGDGVYLWGECYANTTSYIYINNDNLTGPIPSEIGNLVNLTYLTIYSVKMEQWLSKMVSVSIRKM